MDVRRRRAAHGALRARAAGGSSRRSCSAPACCGTCCATAAATTWSTPPRSRTSRCWPPALARRARPLPPRGRLARAVDAATTGASTWAAPAGASAGAVQRLVRAPAPAGLLLLAPARGAPARGGPARRGHGARGRVRRRAGAARRPRPAEPVVVFAGRHIPEKRVPALVPAIATGARDGAGPALRRSSATGPTAPPWRRRSREHGLDGAVEVHGFVDGEIVDRALAHALCMAAALAPRGLRAGRGRGVVARARPAWSSPAPTTRRPSWSTRARTAFVAAVRRPGRPGGGDRAGARGRPGPARAHRGLVRAQRAAAVDRQLDRRPCCEYYRRASPAPARRWPASRGPCASHVKRAAWARPASRRRAACASSRAGARSRPRSRRETPGRTAAPRRPPPRAARSGPSRRPAPRGSSPPAPAARTPRRATGTRSRRRARTGPRARPPRPSRGSARRRRCPAPRARSRSSASYQVGSRAATSSGRRSAGSSASASSSRAGSCAGAWPTR